MLVGRPTHGRRLFGLQLASTVSSSAAHRIGKQRNRPELQLHISSTTADNVMDYYATTVGRRSMSRRIARTTVLLIVLTHLAAVHARQCYVCGIGASDPMYGTMLAQHGAIGQHSGVVPATTSVNSSSSSHMANNATKNGGGANEDDDIVVLDDALDRPQQLLACARFEHADADPHAFLVECPVGYMGCITQSDGTTTMRTCNRFSIDDCKTANRVTYCYCNTDRCNGKDRPTTLLQQLQQHQLNGTQASLTSTAKTTKRQQPFFRDRSYTDDEDDGDDDAAGDDDEDAVDTFEASGAATSDDGHDNRGLIESVWSSEKPSTHSSTPTAETITTTETPTTTTTPATATTVAPENNHNHRSRVGSGCSALLSSRIVIIAIIIPVCLMRLSV